MPAFSAHQLGRPPPVLAYLLPITVFCVALGWFHLGRASLWSDEVFSRYYYDVFGPGFLFTEGLWREPTPPTYPIVLRGWMALFGDSEPALRSLSLMCAALSVPLVFRLGRDLGTPREALAAAMLFALCPAVLYFAQEARVYAMTLLPVGVVLLAVAALLRDPRSRGAAWAYVGGATVGVYLHATLVLLVASCALVVGAVLLARGGRAGWRALGRWAGLNGAVLAFGLPYLSHLAGASRGSGLDWIPPLRLHDLVGSVSAVVAGVLTPWPWLSGPLAAAVLAALAVSVWRHRPSLGALAVLVLIPGVFVALATCVSLVRPILLPRVLFWTAIPLCVLAGRQMLQAGRLRWAVAASTVLAFGVGLAVQETAPDGGKEPWRQALARLAPELAQADLVVLSPRFNPLVLSYYASAISPARVRVWDERLPPTIMTQAADRLSIAPITRAQLLGEIDGGAAVWVLSNAVDLPTLEALQAIHPAQQTQAWRCGPNTCVEAAEWTTHATSKITAKQANDGPHT